MVSDPTVDFPKPAEEFNPLDAVKLASLYASVKRQADALEAIAASLATIVQHLAPVADVAYRLAK